MVNKVVITFYNESCLKMIVLLPVPFEFDQEQINLHKQWQWVLSTSSMSSFASKICTCFKILECLNDEIEFWRKDVEKSNYIAKCCPRPILTLIKTLTSFCFALRLQVSKRYNMHWSQHHGFTGVPGQIMFFHCFMYIKNKTMYIFQFMFHSLIQ